MTAGADGSVDSGGVCSQIGCTDAQVAAIVPACRSSSRCTSSYARVNEDAWITSALPDPGVDDGVAVPAEQHGHRRVEVCRDVVDAVVDGAHRVVRLAAALVDDRDERVHARAASSCLDVRR